ncbi:MAG: 3-ketoacyl-ACP reductase [Spirochaetales bacterium]|nr:MAG: 3-ketoacyl-ACP reductase [Spirochaetales bacterium]
MINKKTALVTGASRGIGRSIAIRLARDGYAVIITSKTAEPDNLEKGAFEVKNAIEQAGGEAFICRADISLKEERDRLIRFAVDTIGRVDLLVNNAGIEPPVLDMLEASEERFDTVVNTNLKGPYLLTQQIAKSMVKWMRDNIVESPRIVFITSVQAYMSSPKGSEYAMTKAALHMAMRNFAHRLGKENIYVFEIAPGIIYTDMSSVHEESINDMIEEGEKLITNRWGRPEDVAALVSAIARGDLDYSTGSTIEVGGGMGLPKL